ncbi:MAG: ABC transporter ATP-binding protein/permease [Alphaproteobacteria bacterium]|nr:MAG: ABC transporter ATP-binding protein/permease [Alphaproteobacteria bacterium]
MNSIKSTRTGLTLHYLWDFLWKKAARRQRIAIFLSLGSLVLSKVLSAGAPVLFKKSIDFLNPGSSHILTLCIVGFVLANILSHVFANVRDIIFTRVESTLHKHIVLNVFQHIHQLSLDFHLKKRTGSLGRIIERGSQSLERFFRFSLFMLAPTLLEILFITGVLIHLYTAFYALAMLSTLSMYILYTYFVTAKRLKIVREMNNLDTQASGDAIDSILNYETVKYFGNETYEYGHYDKIQTAYQRIFVQSRDSLALLNIGQNIIMYGGMLIMLVYAGMEVQSESITAGDFILFQMYLVQLYLPLSNIGFAYRELRLALTNMEEMFGILEEKPQISDPFDACELVSTKGHIRFENVNFSYTPHRQILHDFSLEIKPKQTVAIVGLSGGGKSTLVRLLYKFYEPTSGRIFIDDVDIGSYTQESLRRHIAIVPQDTILFNKTLFYNIAYGKPTASNNQVIAAAKEAELHDFICKLPDGYDTMVGERGLKLSGGEKQRVAIARTLLKNTPILILDEATSALDTQTEKSIQANLRRISKNRTSFIIAHRLSTIVHADTIVVLAQGRIVEQGTHAELLAQHGSYAKLWLKQSQQSGSPLLTE